MDKLIIIAGPTASGKTNVSIEIAKKINGEIISADSMQIYKTLDIGTAKITEEEMKGIPHHMIDICNPNDNFSVAEFCDKSRMIISDILSRKKVPILCGGTGFYIDSIIYNQSFGKTKSNPLIRNELNKILEEKGKEYLYEILKEIDPESAEKIHCNNVKRVIRAIEIYRVTGEKKSNQKDEKKPIYNLTFCCLSMDRKKLYQKINDRVDEMMKLGLLDEAKYVYDNINHSAQCLSAIGYKEFIPYFTNKETLENCISLLKQNTRKYAKRQLTWFRNQNNCEMIDIEKLSLNELAEKIISKYTSY